MPFQDPGPFLEKHRKTMLRRLTALHKQLAKTRAIPSRNAQVSFLKAEVSALQRALFALGTTSDDLQAAWKRGQ